MEMDMLAREKNADIANDWFGREIAKHELPTQEVLICPL
jgi:hypothetical protein